MVLASRTGWKEKKIRWKLPLSKGWAYFHAAMLLDGIPMTFPGGTAKEQAWWEQTEARIKAL